MLDKIPLQEFKTPASNRGQHLHAATLNKETDNLFRVHKFYTEQKPI